MCLCVFTSTCCAEPALHKKSNRRAHHDSTTLTGLSLAPSQTISLLLTQKHAMRPDTNTMLRNPVVVGKVGRRLLQLLLI